MKSQLKKVEIATTVTDPVPHVDPPAPPEGFVAKPLGRGARPLHLQTELASKCAAELRASSTYAKEFGEAAPDPGAVADALQTARAWSDKLQKAAVWFKYVQQQESLAWKDALEQTGELAALFLIRQSRDPKVKKQYPSLAQFFSANKQRAERAAKSRAKKKKKDKAGGASASSNGAGSASPPSPPMSALAPVDPVKAAAVKLLN